MLQDSNTDNKRIAKNTLVLYFRAVLVMAIGLFTSRVLLQTLGITDVGINNAVGGIVALFGFVTASLGNSTSRFITYAIGKNDQELVNKTFANIKCIYYGLAVIVFVLGETVGLWFLYNYMNIPAERFDAALWVYHYSILSSMLGLICVPYSAAVVAHERMSAFAFMSLFGVTYKLMILYILKVIPYDRLIVYSTFFFIAGIINRTIYATYCSKRFEEVRRKPKIDKKQFKEILSFSGWVVGGNIAWIGYTHGLNILLNVFFGPIVNAARGIALQVQGVISQFVTNFQTAMNPQLTKSYASANYARMHQLLHYGTKFSFFLLLLLSLPVFIEAPLILNWWLVEVPDHTITFLRIILAYALLTTMSNPLNISIHATGNIKKFQLIEGNIVLMILPVAYICLKYFKMPPESVFYVLLIFEFIALVARVWIVVPKIKDKYSTYFNNVTIPILKVILTAPIIPFILYRVVNNEFLNFFLVCISCVAFTSASIWLLALDVNERELAKGYFKRIFVKK